MNVVGVLIIFFLLFVLIYAMGKLIGFTKTLWNKEVDLMILAKSLLALALFAISFVYVSENAGSLGIKVTQPNELLQNTKNLEN